MMPDPRQTKRKAAMERDLPANGTRHVTPSNDLIEHVIDWDGECVCGPECIPVPREDGSNGWLYVHHSLDGRELADA